MLSGNKRLKIHDMIMHNLKNYLQHIYLSYRFSINGTLSTLIFHISKIRRNVFNQIGIYVSLIIIMCLHNFLLVNHLLILFNKYIEIKNEIEVFNDWESVKFPYYIDSI